MTITRMRAMMRRFGLWALPLVGAGLLVHALRRSSRARLGLALVTVIMGTIVAGTRLASTRVAVLTVDSSTTYAVVDLGLPPTYSAIVPRSINNNGQIVGFVAKEGDDTKTQRPFEWQEGKIRLLDLGEMNYGGAYCINDEGVIAGWSHGSSGLNRATLWTEGKMQLLEAPEGMSTYAMHINNSLQICGVATSSRSVDAVLWNNGTVRNILHSPEVCTCPAINDGGIAVGTEYAGLFLIEAYQYREGKVTGLPSFGGDGSGAESINKNGEIVGWAEYEGSMLSRAALWSSGDIRDLGTLGGADSGAVHINDRQEIVGWSAKSNGDFRPFLWRSGKMVDINELLPHDSNWILTSVSAINKSGQMIGSGMHNGLKRSFLLTPK